MTLRRRKASCAFFVAALAVCAGARATTWDFSLDVRAMDSNGRDSYLDGGLGKLRYDDSDSGFDLGRLRAAVTQPLGDLFSAHVDISAWGEDDKNPLDLTEAFLEYRPYPSGGFRTRARLGAFYPPMSLESRAIGWETPYTITPSAISSWIGEEIRAVGLEVQTEWLGTRVGKDFDLQLTGALFGWNDPAGVMIALHGFSFSDRQTPLFGRLGERGSPATYDRELFSEIDGRPGFYVGGQARYLDRAVLNVLHYDNRADSREYSPSIDDFAWDTVFDAAALRMETDGEWTAILQWLQGETYINPGFFEVEWEFGSRSALLAKRMGHHMLALRYDDFDVEGAFDATGDDEDGHAWTVAYSFDQGKNWRFVIEWLRVRSDVAARPVLLGETALAKETKVELSVRYAIGGSIQ